MTKTITSFGDLFALAWGFGSQRVLAVAARAGIVRRLAQGPGTAEELSRELEVDELAVGKILRALHAMGAAEAKGERYALVEVLRPLFLPGDGDITPFLDHSDKLNDFWGATLEEWVRTGQHPRRMRDAEGQRRFGAAMKAIASHLAPRAAKELDLSGVRRVLDLGGGIGVFAQAFCAAAPDLRHTVVELPEVTGLGRAEVKGSGFEDRIEFLGGDYHELDLGEGWDLVLLANVVHQEDADGAARLIERAGAALASGGRIAVVDFAIDDAKRENLVGALFAINMRSFGDAYPEPVVRQWMAGAGLTPLPRVHLSPAHWLLTARRP